MAGKCPACGKAALKKKRGDFAFEVADDGANPNAVEHETVIPDAQWEECSSCGEVVLSQDLDRRIEQWQYTREGLLTPGELREIRERLGLSQVEIAKRIGVGEKSYTRWETGFSIQSKANDNLIRLFADDPDRFLTVSNAGRPGAALKKRMG